MRKKPGQPDSVPSSWLSQSSVLAKRLCTTRTKQMPPPRASTLHSSAMGGEPPQPSPCAANIRGGSQAVMAERDSMPGPKFNFTATGFPPCSSNSAGTNQAEIPGPVAMACQTSSGVPGTSTSTWTERRPEASFFTLMLAPWDRISAAKGAPRPPGDARGRRPGQVQRFVSRLDRKSLIDAEEHEPSFRRCPKPELSQRLKPCQVYSKSSS